MARVHVVFYSMYGHVYRLAEAVAAGAREVEGTEVSLFQVAELVPEEALERTGAKAARMAFAHIPIAKSDDLARADAIIFGTPTRFGNVSAQLKNQIDQLSELWGKGELEGKPAGVFVSTASLHGGQETTILTLMAPLIHLGFIIVGVPYSVAELFTTTSGGSPYGPGHLAGADSQRDVDETEKTVCRALGKRVAEVALKLRR